MVEENQEEGHRLWQEGFQYEHRTHAKKKNYAKAIACYKKASRAGNPMAQGRLAEHYSFALGQASNEDTRRAVMLWEMAARKGEIISMVDLGVCYASGIGVKQNICLGIKLLREAAETGEESSGFFLKVFLGPRYIPAQSHYISTRAMLFVLLDMRFNKYISDQEDKSRIAEYWEKLAERKEVHACWYIFEFLHEEEEEKEKDERPKKLHSPLTWLKRAARGGWPEAQVRMGLHYEKGDMVLKDDKKAVFWYKKASRQGHPKGLCHLAQISQAEPKAIEWYTRAAACEIAQAQWNLAMCYENGTGVQIDPNLSLAWKIRAANNHFSLAQQALGRSLPDRDRKLFDVKASVEWTT